MDLSQKQYAKEQLDGLLQEFCSLQSSQDEADFSKKMKSILSNKNEKEKEIFAEVFVEGAKEAIVQSESIIKETNLRLTLDNIFPAISWSYIASNYFKKSRSWLHQRINGSLVNGIPAKFTDLGSGFKIAMRDLEIRGAGNLLGLSQHGHMEAVGYDLYCKMLNEAVQNLKGIHTAVDFATVIDLDVDAYIPAEYIVNETQKLDIYKRIAGIETIKERDEMKDELLDRFGNIPKAVDNLLRIALIRMAAHSLDMTEIKGKNERITFNFRPDAKIDPRKIPDFLKKHKDELSFTAYGNPFFTYKYKKTGLVETDAELLMGRTEELLEEMKELVLETEPVQNN